MENNLNPLIERYGKEKQWVGWKLEEKDGRATKIPYDIFGKRASSIDPKVWSTYSEVKSVSENVGLVFSGSKRLLGIDIDKCLEKGEITHSEKESIEKFIIEADTYCEVSPSNTGLHLFLELSDPLELIANRHSPYEVYTSGRYFTVTQLPYGVTKKVRAVSSEEALKLISILGYPWKQDTIQRGQSLVQVVNTGEVDDAVLLEKMFNSKNGLNIKDLYNGNLAYYENDESRADMALCTHLAFWTAKNASQMERLWLASPLGARKKTFDRQDYRDRTINAALMKCAETHSPSSKKDSIKESSITFSGAISHAELISKNFPEARFSINPFFEQGTVNMVSAAPNSWKSWFFFYFAGCIALGKMVFDKFQSQKSAVMIVNEEDSERLIQDRLNALDLTDPSLQIYYRVARGSKLEKEFVEKLIAEAKEKGVTVIMFDSLRSVHDADENDSAGMQQVMDLFKMIARENITVLFTHHNRKKSQFSKNDDAEASRGSSAINAAVSGHISLEEVDRDEGKAIVVRHLKSKVGEKHPTFEVGIQKADDKINFVYLGESQPKVAALAEAQAGILYQLENHSELLSRKDFVYLKIAGATTIKEAAKLLVKAEKIIEMTRKQAEQKGLKSLSEGKANEKLYTVKKESEVDQQFADF